MTKQKKSLFRKLCLALGIVLLLGAGILLLSWHQTVRTAALQAQDIVQTLKALIPEPRGAAAEDRKNNAMPVLSLDGTDFIGILEIPAYQSALPVCAHWDRPTRYPCRFSGSSYNGTLQIGATTQQGQYDFYRDLSVGDRVYFTDVTGNRYSYEIKEIHYRKHADTAALSEETAPLTLFLQNNTAFEYVILFCDIPR